MFNFPVKKKKKKESLFPTPTVEQMKFYPPQKLHNIMWYHLLPNEIEILKTGNNEYKCSLNKLISCLYYN